MFCFDGDRAGRAAAWRALENAMGEIKQGRQVRFLFLPDGHDPDTLVREEGAAGFEARLATATPLSDYLISELSSRVEMASVDGKARLVELARPLIRRIPSDVYRELLVTQLAEVVRMSAARLGELLAADGADGTPGDGGGTAGARRSRQRRRLVRIERRVRWRSTGWRSRRPPRSGRRVAATWSARPSPCWCISRRRPGPSAATNWRPSAGIDRPGIPLLTELLAQLREDPAASTGAVLERWRDRPEHASLSKLAVAVCIAPDAAGAAAELKSALGRLIIEESPARRLDELLAQARDGEPDRRGKAGTHGPFARQRAGWPASSRGQVSGRAGTALW